jgi:hypothetical protein
VIRVPECQSARVESAAGVKLAVLQELHFRAGRLAVVAELTGDPPAVPSVQQRLGWVQPAKPAPARGWAKRVCSRIGQLRCWVDGHKPAGGTPPDVAPAWRVTLSEHRTEPARPAAVLLAGQTSA